MLATTSAAMVLYERGLLDVDGFTSRVTALHEKPRSELCKVSSRLASVVFYVLRAVTLETLPAFLAEEPDVERRSFGRYASRSRRCT